MTPSARGSVLAYLALAASILAPASACADDVTVSASGDKGVAGKEVEVFISLIDVRKTGGVGAMDLRLQFDSDAFTFKSFEKGSVLPDTCLVAHRVDAKAAKKLDRDLMALAFACGRDAVENDGVVFKIVFVVKDDAKVGSKHPIKLVQVRVTNSKIAKINSTVIDGYIEIIRDPKEKSK